jgi:hypothetical protein
MSIDALGNVHAPQGQSTGGQFVRQHRGEPDVSLTAGSAPEVEVRLTAAQARILAGAVEDAAAHDEDVRYRLRHHWRDFDDPDEVEAELDRRGPGRERAGRLLMDAAAGPDRRVRVPADMADDVLTLLGDARLEMENEGERIDDYPQDYESPKLAARRLEKRFGPFDATVEQFKTALAPHILRA